MANENTKNTFQIISEYIQAFVGAVILAILIRGFVFEPFKIPSESMVPTLLVGDHIFVARYQYGLRIPFTKTWIAEFDDPKRGDVVVFNYPEDEDIDFIKRVVGLPGDTVSIRNGALHINDRPVALKGFTLGEQNQDNACVMDLPQGTQELLSAEFLDFPYYSNHDKFDHKLEVFDQEQAHMIQRSKNQQIDLDFEFKVPARSFFVMGDNRDQSQDSRFWGVVPRENLKGKAIYIWLSLSDEEEHCAFNPHEPGLIPNIRWDRFGRSII